MTLGPRQNDARDGCRSRTPSISDAVARIANPSHKEVTSIRFSPDVPVNGVAISPSLLAPSRGTASYELKFLLRPEQAEHAQAWAGRHLVLDPHADAALGDAYRIRSIYLDTNQFDIFHQAPFYKRRKFRLRRYGDEHNVYLERKSKLGDRVTKRRTPIADHELCRFRERPADPSWPGFWFHRTLLARRFQPRCLISYERVAHVGMSSEGPMRLTLDRGIHCMPTDSYGFDIPVAGIPLLAPAVILELKFRSALPALFKRLIQEMALNPTGISKYRLGVQAWGLAGGPPAGALPQPAAERQRGVG